MDDAKKPYQSKTLWINLAMSILAFVPAVQVIVTPEILGAIFGIVNTGLRLMTSQAITLKK